jgi:hypothetical protein
MGASGLSLGSLLIVGTEVEAALSVEDCGLPPFPCGGAVRRCRDLRRDFFPTTSPYLEGIAHARAHPKSLAPSGVRRHRGRAHSDKLVGSLTRWTPPRSRTGSPSESKPGTQAPPITQYRPRPVKGLAAHAAAATAPKNRRFSVRKLPRQKRLEIAALSH